MSLGRRLLVVLLFACSAWGAWLSFAVLKGRLPEPWAQRSLPFETAAPELTPREVAHRQQMLAHLARAAQRA